MLTFSNTIITNKTYLNLNLVQTILFEQLCNDDGISIRCVVIFFSDNSVSLVSEIETFYDYDEDISPHCDNPVLLSRITWNGDLFPVIRDKKLYQNLCDLCLTENE